MKRVDIISKVVGRYSSGKPVGGGISIPMGNYALKSEVESLKSMFNDFLEGDDTDSVINRWKDLEVFLNGISEEDPLTSILGNYIPIAGVTDITGEKNFTGGLKVNGSPIYYDTDKKYWKLEGDLLVTGGVTMYGDEGTFTPSTIMDAILYDDSTLGINAQGQLYVKGSVGGATTLGSLSNVGSWADSVASQDRIMYQAANSSQWVAKNLSDLAVGGVTGDYLPLNRGIWHSKTDNPDPNTKYGNWMGMSNKNTPDGAKYYHILSSTWNNIYWSSQLAIPTAQSNNMYYRRGASETAYNSWVKLLDVNNYSSYALPLSGGTLTGTLAIINEDVALCLYRQQNNGTPYIRFAKNATTQYGELGVYNDGRLVFWPLVSSQGGYNQWNTVWHSGNDGSGSGLDADLLDGVHLMGASGGVGIMQALPRNYTTANQFFGNGNIVIFDPEPTDVSGWGAHSTVLSLGNRETRNHQIIFSIYGGSPMPRYRRNIDGVWSEVRTFAFLDDNVASATKATQDGDGRVITDTYFSDRGASNSFDDKIYNGAYRTSSFKPNDAYGYGLVASFRSMETCAQIYFPDGNREPQFRMQWNSHTSITNGWTALVTSSSIGNYNAGSATKLQTARTIWGQSFDGSGDVDGTLHITKINNEADTYDEGIRINSIGGYSSIWLNTANRQGYDAGMWGITANNGGNLRFRGGASTLSDLMNITQSGNVGIGTPNPYSKLHSVGDITVSVPSNNPTASINFMNTSSDFWQISGRYSSSEKGTFKTYYYNGSTWSTIVTLYNTGNMLVSGGITMYSDIRKKTKLKDVVLSLQQVANAPLIEHYYNSDQNKTTHVGSIAQYWAELNDWFCKKDSEGFYIMEIQNAALASAISVARELVKFETETDRRIRLLEEENKRLKEEVEQLKWNIA